MLTPMSLQAVTGQLYLIEGETQETTAVPGLLAQSAPNKAARSRERDALFIHLSLTGQPGETAVLYQDLLDIISQHFFQSSGSVTAALRQAIIKANELLLRLNVSGVGESREGAITCAVLHNSELFVLQTGEGLAMLGHNYGVEELPPKKPDRITPLGRSAGIDIRYSHHRLETGDLLLLADPRVAHMPSQAFAPALVDTEIEVGLGALADVVGEETGRFLLVEFTQDAPADFLAVTQVSQRSGRQLAALPAPTPVRESAAEQVTTSVMAVENKARKATSEAAMGLSRLTAWLANLMASLRPPQQVEVEAEPINKPIAASVAIIIPIAIALIVTAVYLQRGLVRRMSEIKDEMRQNMILADEAGDDETQLRAYYAAALQLAVEADQLDPTDGDISQMRQEIQGELDRLENVTRLVARPFYTFNETVQLTAVVLREGFNGGIYTLDGANSNVYWHDTDESYVNPASDVPEQILFRGQAFGSHVVNNIVDIMWRPRGLSVSREGLAMLDDNGALLTYFSDFGDLRAVPLGFASEWQFPTEITSFGERLYILDNGAASIWKYFPDGENLIPREDERTLALPEADLAHVRDLAIYSEDGSLALVYDDGRIRYYDTLSGRIKWDELTLLQNGFTSPLLSPTAVKMIGPGANASVFVADPGSGRIVEISRGGLVLTQFRAADENGRELFANITDFAVAKAPLRIFVTAGNTLFLATQE
jgi:hypothetical protein